MSRKEQFIIIILLISIATVFSTKGRTIVSYPDLSKTSKKFSGYTIDFRAIDAPAHTYFCLLQWVMDKTEFEKTPNVTDVQGAVVYGGVQSTDTEPHGIMSVWQIEYKEKGVAKKLRATRIYPKGEQSTFTNEGEGTNYIATYIWSPNVWYRYTIHSWEDRTTQTTFVGQWIQNLSTKEWTLFAYYDTKLKNSYITGPFFQFLENYLPSTYGLERSSQYKNMYAFDKMSSKWVSLNTTKLYCNFGAFNGDTGGTSDFGYTSNYFYMSSGLLVDDQKAYDEGRPSSVTATIKQPSTPEGFISPSFKSFDVTLTKTKLTINWTMDSKTSPCYQYHVHVKKKDSSGEIWVQYEQITRPEVKTYSLTQVFKGDYIIKLYCNAISDQSVVKTINKTI